MAVTSLYAAESWDRVYKAFENVNFVSYDYEAVKESLIQYMKMYYAEVFNDYIESSELIAIIDTFAVMAEQLAYRVDMASHELFISTAQRKQNILKLAKLISYNSARNLPARGLVKITSVSSTETIIDSQGNDLSNRTIIWNDANNSLWKEQFFLVMNRMLVNPFGQPSKAFQVGDIAFQLYTINTIPGAFARGVFQYSAETNSDSVRMEIVPSDLDGDGVFERTPDNNGMMSIVYANDGLGDASDLTGFLMYTKQGTLINIPLSFNAAIPNQSIDVNVKDVNNVDVWLNKVDTSGATVERWEIIDNINSQNIYFNANSNSKKFEVETLEDDKIRLLFGDGNFAEMPVGDFNLWVRQSSAAGTIIQKNKVVNIPMGLTYNSTLASRESASMSFSLVSTLQNSSASEDIEHIRRAAPATYYSQGRMVNGQDYNTLLLRDSSVLKLKAINRTFAGQPKYIDWNDASGNYQNVKIFGDDLRIYYDLKMNSMVSKESSRTMIDSVIEPMLKSATTTNMITYMTSTNAKLRGIKANPRYKFIEDSKFGLKEKTEIQGRLDRHWYGEASNNVTIGGILHAVVSGDDDYLIYNDTIPRTIDGVNPYLSGLPSGLQPASESPVFGIGFTIEVPMKGNGTISGIVSKSGAISETWTIELISDTDGTYVFSVTGSESGNIGLAIADSAEAFDSDLISFAITSGDVPFALGDAFVIDVVNNVVAQRTFPIGVQTFPGINLNGRWYTVSGEMIDTESAYSVAHHGETAPGTDRSWIFMISRNDDDFGNTRDWEIRFRDLRMVVESPTTKFWYNTDSYIVDSNSKNRVRDRIAILKSNLTKDRKLAIGTNKNFDVIDSVKFDNGVVNVNSLEVLPTDATGQYNSGDGIPDDSMAFAALVNTGMIHIFEQKIPALTWDITHNLGTTTPAAEFIGLASGVKFTIQAMSANRSKITFKNASGTAIATAGKVSLSNLDTADYVYFKAPDPTDPNAREVPVNVTPEIKNMFGANEMISSNGLYTRKIGRDGLDFLWQHFSPNSNLIDPSTSNLIDMFVLTRGYYDNVMSYVNGTNQYKPVAPTPLELRNSYSSLLASKMISDTVVMHSGKIRLLFGSLAEPQLRSKFRVIKSMGSTLTDDQIKAEIVNVIKTFFTIDNWDFGNTFYATELFSLIHQRLPQDVASVVLVPLFVNNSFGSMFVVEPAEDEILQSCATIDDIEIVNTFTPTTLRQLK